MMSFLPRPETTRIALPIAFAVCYLAYHAIVWWRRRPAGSACSRGASTTGPESACSRGASATGPGSACSDPAKVLSAPVVRVPHAHATPSPAAVAEGEALYAQARGIPHGEIPDFENDGEYLRLLGKSAAAGFPPAMAKLGEYAIRREAWVEAFHWFSKAKDAGLRGVDPTLRQIRVDWAMARRPEQRGSESEIFAESDRAAAYSRLCGNAGVV